MTTAQDIMTPAPQCVRHDQTLVDAARMMATMDVGSLPICGPEGKLVGMLTDRDIVVRCLAAGDDPSAVTAGELAEGKPTYVAADADIGEVLRVMQEQQIRRVPPSSRTTSSSHHQPGRHLAERRAVGDRGDRRPDLAVMRAR